ncbi:hypothetical protein [Limnohabitans sp. Rim47]|uniref:hypothetical protein n=1 Tax=Limnohabitans sp. Rim47 TaxID=1100721 RepID=UPI0002E6421D|nr:hypothetical protein [Limnohabitans sp. Rim47]
MTTSLASTVRQRSGPVAQFKRAGQAAVMLLLWLAASGVHAQSAQPSAVADGMLQAVNPPGKVKTGLTPTAKQHEAQLSAIRQAILQATMDRPTRVLSSAWIDDKGALHESAHFQSEAQVRGVRVLSYVTDEKDTAPQVSAEVLPWGWRTAQTKATTCTAPPRPWRLPLVLQTRADSGFGGTQQFASQAVLNTVSQAWTQHMQSSQRWRALHKETPPESAYLRALTGPSEGTTGWTAELVLKPYAPEPDLNLRQAWHAMNRDVSDWRWTLSFTLGERHTPGGPIEAHWQIEHIISIDPLAAGQNPSAWVHQLKEPLQKQMQAWVQQLDKRSACEPIQFHVRRNGQDTLQLQAGLGSGLRPGDRVLLLNPSQIPSQMLEPGATQHLALAQVVKVGNDQTELQQLAGPALPTQGHWMALPL